MKTHIEIKTEDGSRFILPTTNTTFLYEAGQKTIQSKDRDLFFKFGLEAASDTYLISQEILDDVLAQLDEVVK